MALLIAIVPWLLLVVLTLLCLVLTTPLIVRVHLTTLPQIAYRVEMRALAGLGPFFTVAVGPRKSPVDKPHAKRSSKAARPKRRGILSRKRGRDGMIQALPTLIGGVMHRVRLTKLNIDADYGLEDPADTGQLCGLLMPLQYTGLIPENVLLNLRPDFTKPGVNGSLTVFLRVTLAALLIPVTRFAWRAYGSCR